MPLHGIDIDQNHEITHENKHKRIEQLATSYNNTQTEWQKMMNNKHIKQLSDTQINKETHRKNQQEKEREYANEH